MINVAQPELAVIISLVASTFSVRKLFSEAILYRKTRSRDEYKFVKEFLTDITSPESHPYLVEKGFAAISGKDNLTADEIRFFLSQPNPSLSIKRYSAARQHYVEYSECERRVKFIGKFTDPAKIEQSEKLNGFGYFVFALLSLAPLFFTSIFASNLFEKNWQMAAIFIVVFLVAFGPLAFFCLLEVDRITKGKKLVDSQRTPNPPLNMDAPSIGG
jgi:hypothetical protein